MAEVLKLMEGMAQEDRLRLLAQVENLWCHSCAGPQPCYCASDGAGS